MSRNYRVGIDVGSFSIGFAAIEVNEDNIPISILSASSLIHDSGLDPDKIKYAVTRLASSGVARRTRRLYRNKRRRLQKLDKYIHSLGWPTTEFEDYEDPFLPWKVRAELALSYVEDEAERGEKISMAMRHIARHRGWRNPYSKVNTLHTTTAPSEAFNTIKEEIHKATGRNIPDDVTVGQMIALCSLGSQKLRGDGGVLSARLQQSDHANEILKIAETQKLDRTTTIGLIDAVFAAESPKGSAEGRVGKDPLQPGKKRALKATDSFQRYRIAALLGNLRIRQEGKKRVLTKEERLLIFDYLVNLKHSEEPTWLKVAEILNIDRGQLLGTATMTDDGERAGAVPPVHGTNRAILRSNHKELISWWKQADKNDQRAMIKALANAEVDDFDSESGAKVQEFFAGLTDEDHQKLDSLHLPIGRAAYSEDTLERITSRMLDEGVDLYQARLDEFGIAPDWAPPAPPVGEPVGNPAVDRVLKAVSRWLENAVSVWGPPLSVNIEHVRAAFTSEAVSRQIERDQANRHKRNMALFADMQQKLGVKEKPRRSDLWRYQSVQRQNGQCAYCGSPISYGNCEMDHIVPRAGQGSTNKRENLVAVCHRCNLQKRNIPFAVWAERSSIPGVSVKEAVERTRHWIMDPGLSPKDFKKFRSEVVTRFERSTVDEEIDARSLESVAWMANELRGRINQAFQEHGTSVRVYKGALTAEARYASGIARRLVFIDGPGKSRLDRRHHAIDAAVVAFATPYVAEVLAQRVNLREEQRITGGPEQWKEFTGADEAHRSEWRRWVTRMQALSELLNTALAEDEIVVMSNLRLRLGNGLAHKEGIHSLDRSLTVGSELSAATIDKAATEALWCALTRHPDFDPKNGLPADPSRTIKVNGKTLTADDNLEFFPVNAGAMKLRNGYVRLGSAFHHARIYKITSGKKTVFSMMRVYTVDLLKHRHEDLFSVELKPQSMTVRQCEPKLRTALAEGTAEYLGWLVVDDELLIDTTAFNTGQVYTTQQELGTISRWRLTGFETKSQLGLRPLQMSAEGLKADANPDLRKIIDTKGWRPAVNKLFTEGRVVVLRRDALGRVRLTSDAHLPISWKVQ